MSSPPPSYLGLRRGDKGIFSGGRGNGSREWGGMVRGGVEWLAIPPAYRSAFVSSP